LIRATATIHTNPSTAASCHGRTEGSNTAVKNVLGSKLFFARLKNSAGKK
jgi:hypothetical protein